MAVRLPLPRLKLGDMREQFFGGGTSKQAIKQASSIVRPPPIGQPSSCVGSSGGGERVQPPVSR